MFGPDAGQREFYGATAAPMVRGLMDSGLSSVMMAYGVSGAGKTYTMEARHLQRHDATLGAHSTQCMPEHLRMQVQMLLVNRPCDSYHCRHKPHLKARRYIMIARFAHRTHGQPTGYRVHLIAAHRKLTRPRAGLTQSIAVLQGIPGDWGVIFLSIQSIFEVMPIM